MKDVNLREFALMAPLVILMFVLGFAPNTFLAKSEPATSHLLEVIEAKRLATEAVANEAERLEREQDAPQPLLVNSNR